MRAGLKSGSRTFTLKGATAWRPALDVTLSQAQTCLGDLVDQATSGADVVISLEDGRAVQLVDLQRKPPVSAERRRQILEEVAASGSRNATPGPSAARSQDFLYDDETGLPA